MAKSEMQWWPSFRIVENADSLQKNHKCQTILIIMIMMMMVMPHVIAIAIEKQTKQ